MRRPASIALVAGAIALGTGGAAEAGPTCTNFGFANHGDHVLDYVEDGSIAGGAPAHHGSGFKPGATFCLENSQARPVHW